MRDIQGFIEVARVFGEKRFLKLININNIIDVEDGCITTKRILNCEYTQTSYSETIQCYMFDEEYRTSKNKFVNRDYIKSVVRVHDSQTII